MIVNKLKALQKNILSYLFWIELACSIVLIIAITLVLFNQIWAKQIITIAGLLLAGGYFIIGYPSINTPRKHLYIRNLKAITFQAFAMNAILVIFYFIDIPNHNPLIMSSMIFNIITFILNLIQLKKESSGNQYTVVISRNIIHLIFPVFMYVFSLP